MKPLFKRDARLGGYLFRLTLLAVALLVFDKNGGMASVRYAAQTIAAPVFWLTDLPRRVEEWTDDNLISRERLIARNTALIEQSRLMESKLLALASLEEENRRLRALLQATDRVAQVFQAAQVIGVVPDPERQILVIDKGIDDGIHPSIAMLDQFGVVGQVVSATASTAHVLLLTDRTHAIPAKVLRTGVRSVIEGTGNINRLNLLFVPLTSDIQVGDLVVTSGLGGVFPEGYPVGEVETILRDPNEAFLQVNVRPLARVNQSNMLIAMTAEKLSESDRLPNTESAESQ